MTDPNKYNPYPQSCAIRCPRCHSESTFRFPFRLLNEWELHKELDTKQMVQRWGNWHVVVYFPDLFPWIPPVQKGFRTTDWGVCICPVCAYRNKHKLVWPDDAYYCCEVRGHTLWAWTRGHVVALRDYIATKNRKDYTPYGCFLFLRHIPKVFLLAKNRDAVLKQLERLLCT